jgi:hypothetical protein
MFRPLTYEQRLEHPRRCQAHSRRTGKPCGKFAAKGATVCNMHGGATPQTRRKALLRRMIALDQAAQAEAAFNVMLPPEIHPLVSGGGRGRKKAAPKTAPETPEPTPLDGISNRTTPTPGRTRRNRPARPPRQPA